MTATPVNARKHGTGRTSGYVVAVLINVIMLILVNLRPGWRELPFLTEDLAGILWLINLSMLTSAVLNLAYLLYDPAWFSSVGQIAVSAIGMAAAIRLWQVFPFDFSAYSFTWAAVTRVLLVLGIFGSAVAIVAELVRLPGRRITAGARSQSPEHP